jgi:hypothetical protein
MLNDIEEYYVDEIDKSLCTLNKELIKIKGSYEYINGMKFSKLVHAFKYVDSKAIRNALHNKKMHRKLKPYFKRNKSFLTFDPGIETTTRVAVYTAITGGYDVPIEPCYVPANVDFFIITDMDISEKSVWKKIDINSDEKIAKLDNTRKARFAKTHPHLFFKEYEYSVWIDSNFKAVGDLTKFIKCIGPTVPFASNWHPDRNSIYTELGACIVRSKDNARLLQEQIDYYRKQGMPDDFGLIETNMIVRKHNEQVCVDLMEAWWHEILKWSKRDQLSLPYVIWKAGYSMKDLGFIGTEVRANSSVQVEAVHTTDYQSPHM